MTKRIASASVETRKRSFGRKFLNDVVRRWQAGEAPNALAAINSHPEVASVKSLVIDLAYEEFCLRSEAGETLDIGEFCSRFPDYQTSIQKRLEVHEFFADSFPSPGQTVFGLKLIDELGRGALGRVYLAEELDIGNRLVAVKIAYHGKYEAEFLGRLRHPNIVPVYSVHHDDLTGLSAVVMPYFGDQTLADARPKDINAVLAVAIQLAEALTYTHSQGILHRDLKPSNILMAERPMIMDFNLSTDLSADAQRLGGTPQYMAPEQAAQLTGEKETEIDERADIYSLGVILRELLEPFRVGPVLSDVVRRATAPRAEDRFASAAELASALRRQLGPYRRAIRWSTKHPAYVAILLMGCAVAGYLIATRPPYAEREMAKALQAMKTGDPSAAIAHLLNVTSDDPRNAEAQFLLGRARLQAGKIDAALENFDDAYNLTKDGKSAACAAFASGLRADDPHRMKYWHDLALAAGFNSPEMENNIGFSYRRTGDFAAAREHLHRALERKPGMSTALLNLALIDFLEARQLGKTFSPEILARLETAMARCEPSESLFSVAAYAYSRSSTPNTAKTIELLEKAVNNGADPRRLRDEHPKLHGYPKFEAVLAKPRNAKHVPPVTLSDPLGEFPATLASKYE